MKKTKILMGVVFFLIAVFFVSDLAYAGWTQAKGHAYNQLTWAYYTTKKKLTSVKSNYDGVAHGTGGGVKRMETAKYTAETISFFTMYGIRDDLSLIVSIPWVRTESDDVIKWAGGSGPSGIGDILLGLRYRLSPNLFGSGVVTSLQGMVKIPEGYKYGDPMTLLSLGEGQYDTTLSLVFGKGLGGKGYAVLETGYKYRFDNTKYYEFKPSDQIKVSISGGYAILSQLSIRGSIDWTKSVGNASVSENMRTHAMLTGQTTQKAKDNLLIRDTLGLEADALSVGGALAFNISPKVQTVLSYTTDIDGIDIFETKDYSLGETLSVSLVYMF